MFNTSEAEIWVLPLRSGKKPSPFVRATAAFDAQFSPDGRWVAYRSMESGTPQVYVVPFESSKILNGSLAEGATGGKWQISSDGGSVPRWRADGKEIFYVGPENTFMAVNVETKGSAFEVGSSNPLFTAPLNPFTVTYDVTPDGTRFVVPVASGAENLPLTVMFNWPSKLRTD
jgi:Tol biopolymer transport system component